MRFFFLVLVFSSLLASPMLYAQDQRLSMGLVAGMTANSGGGTGVDNFYDSTGTQIPGALSTNLIGGNLGVFIQYQLPEYFFGVQIESMLLFNRGMSYIDAVNHEFKATISGNEASFNFLVQAIIPTTETIRFTISVGPTFAVPMGEFKQVYQNSKTGITDQINFKPHPVSYGILAGIGIHIDLGPGFFVIDGRFAMDFSPFTAEREISLNTPMTLQVGYAVDLWRGEKR